MSSRSLLFVYTKKTEHGNVLLSKVIYTPLNLVYHQNKKNVKDDKKEDSVNLLWVKYKNKKYG